MAKWQDKVWEFLRDEPVYSSGKPSDASLAEGWKLAFEMEREKLDVAEKRLTLLYGLADAITEANIHPQYGRDIRAILEMGKAELAEKEYGDY